MNYRHGYHAGNFADVLKHAVLCWIVRYLQQKEAPLCLIDTHAGRGVYDLAGTEAAKTGEANDGIGRLVGRTDIPAPLKPWLDLVFQSNPDLKTYPGSPALLTALTRPKDRQRDRIVLCELHPGEAALLRQTLARAKNTRIVTGDGYATLSAQIPPAEKRGLVLIDPPFEEPEELENLARSFISAHRKWPLGVYILWFPVKDQSQLNRFRAELQSSAISKLTLVTMDVDRDTGLSQSGLLIANAPYTFDAEWRPALDWLTRTLAQGENPSFNLDQI